MTAYHPVYIGLGSNLNNPNQQIKQALHHLKQLSSTHLLKHSSLYRSAPLGPPNQPDYINAVAVLQTGLAPLNLLYQLQLIEQKQGRIRTAQRWGARTLDLDILLYGNQQSQDPLLTLPHPGLYNRAFVLYPLYECVPDLCLPNGQLLTDLISNCCPDGLYQLSI